MTAVIARSSTTWTVDPIRANDRDGLTEMFERCSHDTVVRRFFGLVRRLPPRYLADVLAARPEYHDAVVARTTGGRVIGLASLGTGCGLPEVGVLVEDEWQRRGVGTALADALLARARERGVVRVVASVLPGREAVLTGLDRRLRCRHVQHTSDATTHVYEL